VSRARARAREERERQAATARAQRDRRSQRLARRRARLAAVRARVPRRIRWRRQQGLLARRRRAQNAVVTSGLLASQVVVWLVSDNWWVRATALLLALCATPVLLTLAFDRRS
jgi:Flp pilus assembly protein TadB